MAESISTHVSAPRTPRRAADGQGGGASRLAGWLSPTRRGRAIAFETLLTTAVLVALGHALDPADPLQTQADFPWIWLAPAVFALRYGTLAGVGSGGLLVLAGFLFEAAHAATTFPPAAFFFGGFALVLIAGQFGDIWAARARQARAANAYLAERLSVLTKHQFLLRLSHERLEQDVLARPATLRDALGRLRALALDDEPAEPAQLAGAARFLETAAHACQFDRAALYSWHQGAFASTPSASIGEPFVFDPADPLVREAFETGTLAHPQSGAPVREAKSRYLACAPLVDAAGEPVGMLVVEHMPFLALTRDNLQFLLVMCGYYADGLRHAPVTRELVRAFDACPYDFALDYARLARLYGSTKIESSLVALVFEPGESSRAWREHVLRTRRALDAQWSRAGTAANAVLTLMPLAGGSAVDGYLMRMEESLRAQFGVTFERARIGVYSMRVDGAEPVAALGDFLARCDARA
ncbi:PelD GGDEF domain-containing protein [Burkholderia alba]|uniref:PelD GGDEF domain-containing protein n=1 Tax=Burkholderia alba TaxID=2683677 RepID=UPI002B05DB3B|nr:PelD GGDEF domain-containing protein [Burkholderia alba]